MDSMKVGWKKQAPSQVQFFSNTTFQQHSIQKSKNPEKKSNKKKVQFNCQTNSTKQQTFNNRKYNLSNTLQSDRSILKDSDLISASTICILPTDVTIADHKSICSVRAKAITFIIVILIILAAAIAAGVTMGMTQSQQSSSGTVTGDNNIQNLLSTISSTVVTSSISLGSQSGAPCTSYTTINDPTRNVNQTAISGTCDRGPLFNASNGGSWIRFVGIGGTIIPFISPGMNHCGGFSVGWFNGTLPTALGAMVNGTVCFEVNLFSCWLFNSIYVVNCGGFYVYFLLPVPLCNSRYCTT